MEQIMVLQDSYPSKTKRAIAGVLIVLWELVDSLRPPWLQFMGCMLSLIWVNAVVSGWSEFVYEAPPQLQLFHDILGSTLWGVTSFTMAVLCGYAFLNYQKRLVRRWVLFAFSIYAMIPAVIMGLAIPGSPMGQWCFILSVLCFVAFLRPLVLHWIERLKEKTDSQQ